MIKCFPRTVSAALMALATLLCAFSFWVPLGYSTAFILLAGVTFIAVIRNGSKRGALAKLEALPCHPEISHPRIGTWILTGLHVHPVSDGHVIAHGGTKPVFVKGSTLMDAVDELVGISEKYALSPGTFCKGECPHFEPPPTREEADRYADYVKTLNGINSAAAASRRPNGIGNP